MTTPAWTTPSDIVGKLQRLWDRGTLLSARLEADTPLFPYEMRIKRPNAQELGARFGEAQQWIRSLDDGSRAKRGTGYDITWEEVHHRQLGLNQIPAGIIVPTERDALHLLRKGKEAARFSEIAEATVRRFPELRAWLVQRPLVALSHEAKWERILAVLSWFQDHPRSNVYLRQVDAPGVDTKFLESHRGLLSELLDRVLPPNAIETSAQGARQFEARYGVRAKPPLIRFRVLDRSLLLGPLADISTVPAQFARLALPVERVFITENEINGLAFPEVSKSIVIFGLGYGIQLLADIEWLRDRAIVYWGDIDTHGFAMLDRLRMAFPNARSMLMDRETLMRHRAQWSRELAQHTARLERLTPDESALYDDLREDRLSTGVRLEQEHVAYGWLKVKLREHGLTGEADSP